jgi:hypothetical protein
VCSAVRSATTHVVCMPGTGLQTDAGSQQGVGCKFNVNVISLGLSNGGSLPVLLLLLLPFRFDTKAGTCYSEFVRTRQETAPAGPYLDPVTNTTKYRYTWTDGHADLQCVPRGCGVGDGGWVFGAGCMRLVTLWVGSRLGKLLVCNHASRKPLSPPLRAFDAVASMVAPCLSPPPGSVLTWLLLFLCVVAQPPPGACMAGVQTTAPEATLSTSASTARRHGARCSK